MTNDDFFPALAACRASLAGTVPADFAQAVDSLPDLARNSQERILIAAVEIHYGAKTGSAGYRAMGIDRLRAASDDQLLEVVRAIPELTMLGDWPDRKALLWSLVASSCPADDLALSFVTDPGAADARQLKAGRWQPAVQLADQLGRELRMWVVWTAFGAWLRYRSRDYLEVVNHESLCLQRGEPGQWEYGLVRALAALSVGEVEDAAWQLQSARKLRGHDGPWVVESLRRAMTLYGPLAGGSLKEWFAAAPGPPVDPADARSTLEEAAFELVRSSLGSGRVKADRFTEMGRALKANPWLAFCWFQLAPRGPVLDAAGALLLETVKSADDARRWPWSGRLNGFAEACCALGDRRVALELLTMAIGLHQRPELRVSLVRVLSEATPRDLIALRDGDYGEVLQEQMAALPAGRQAMLRRGGLFRAVVDGSNVAWGGLSRAANATPRLDLVRQVLRDLKAAGFEELILFFDASSRHDLKGEWGWVEAEQAVGRAIVTPGQADPHVIDTFLEDPAHSVIVSNDQYNTWLPQKPALREHWPRCSRRFFLDAGRVKWERPLDQPNQDAR